MLIHCVNIVSNEENTMDVNKTNEVMEILNKIMEYELSGVVRYTH